MENLEKNGVALRLRFKEKKNISLLELSSLLYDIILLYDCVILATTPEYKKYRFTPYFSYRKSRSLRDEHKLYVNKIRYESPMEVVLLILMISPAIWYLVSAFEKVCNFKLNRKKLKLGIQHLQIKQEVEEVELENALQEREALKIFKNIVKRINKQDISIIDADFYIIDDKESPDATEDT